ncbi:MAG: hypothetical protein J6D37_07900 [Clostridia bacterium]|nr:hypothetical protein [Clostridia bacterium]
MELTPDQILGVKEWNEMITAEVENALGSELDGKFTAANYPAGFNYQVKLKNYNADSLKALDTKVEVADEIPCLKTGYTSLYNQVIGKIFFRISEADRRRINEEANEQAALISAIITDYKESDIDEELMKDPTVPKIMKRIKEVTGTSFDKVNLREYPYLSTLCNRLSEFTRKAVFTSKIQRAAEEAEDRLEAIRDHIKNPSEENGGLKTDHGYVCGWDNLKEPTQLLDSLKGGNSITFGFTANEFHEKTSHLNFKNKAAVSVPVNWLFNMSAKHSDEYDLSQFAENGSEFSVTVTYEGVTVLPANPALLSADNGRGWYASDILEEAAAKSGKDVTGYQLVDSEFDPETLFGANGKLRRMRTLIISQQPSLELHFSKFDCAGLKKHFEEQTELQFKLLGGLISAEHENSYSVSECSYHESSQSLDVRLTPKPLGSSGTAENQTAYVLGGVADYFDNNVEVKKIRLLSVEELPQNAGEVPLPEECKNLKLKYRKNKDDKYEFAGFYDESADVEDMLGDNVALPITSYYIGLYKMTAGTSVWNVRGSTGDHCHGYGQTSWKDLWEHFTKKQASCYVCSHLATCPHATQRLVGAHLVRDPNRVIPADRNQRIYIVPICNSMNHYTMVAAMQINRDVQALELYRFLEF